jgi:hypothetical protein
MAMVKLMKIAKRPAKGTFALVRKKAINPIGNIIGKYPIGCNSRIGFTPPIKNERINIVSPAAIDLSRFNNKVKPQLIFFSPK